MKSSDNSLPPSALPLRQAFEALVTVLNERGVRYALIGGLALIQHTRVRTTDDIDVLLTLPQVAMPGFFEALRDRGLTVDVARNTRELRDDGFTRVRFSDVVVDLMLPVIPSYTRVLDRTIDARILGLPVRTSSAEGLIVLKLSAMRPQDQADIQELLAVYRDRLDLEFVRTELARFTPPDDPRRALFESWVRGAAAPD